MFTSPILRALIHGLCATILLAFAAACSTSGDDAAASTTPQTEQPEPDRFEELRQQADEAYAGRGDFQQAQKAIGLWEQALQTDTAIADEVTRAELHEAIAKAHYFIARYHHADGVEITSNEALEDSVNAGLDAAEEALQIRAPEFYGALQRGAPFEEDLPPANEEAVDALLWFAKNLTLLSHIDGVSADVSATPVVEAIMEFIIDVRPETHHGAALRYFGVHRVHRPFHRSPEQSREAFEKSLEMEPNFLLTRLLQARHLATFQGDREFFESELRAIIDSTNDGAVQSLPENEMARQWATSLLEQSDELFD